MLSVVLNGLRTRWVTLLGTFIALGLGVGLIATMGLALSSSLNAPVSTPQRFAGAPVVVRGADTLRVPTPVGVRTSPLAEPRPVSPALARQLAAVGRTVPDRSFPVRVDDGPRGAVGHPWSVAAFGPYRLTAGHPPVGDAEIVTAGTWAHPGQTVAMRTATGTTVSLTVVGTVPGNSVEDPVFFSDARAAVLSPRIDNLVVFAAPDAVRRTVAAAATAANGGADASDAQVLVGEQRRLADPDPDRDGDALVAVNALLGTAAGVTGFVAVFVVASTFSFGVAQRRREFGLLRTAGATPRQIRRTVFAEALLVGVSASLAGCVTGAYGAPRLAAWMVRGSVAPPWFSIGDATWPSFMAFGTGLLVSLAGVWAAARRAGRTSPMDALREAAVDSRTMTPGRWICATVMLLTGLGMLVTRLVLAPGDALHRKTWITQPMELITACALFAPVLVRPLVRLLGRLPARLPGAGGMLVRENATAGLRRTAAITAPVLVTVALTGSLLGATATISAGRTDEIRAQSTAEFVVTAPAGAPGGGLDPGTVARVLAVPGTTAATSAPSAVYTLDDGVALSRDDAQIVDPAALAQVTALPLVSGSIADLNDHSIIVNQGWAKHTVGESVDVWLGDGSRATLRIAAVMRTGTGNNGVYLTARNATGAVPDRIDVTVLPGTDDTTALSALRAAVPTATGRILTKAQWVTATAPRTDRTTRIGLELVLGIALLYTAIALANTLVMATSDRIRELAVLRLAGAAPRQLLRLVAAEALLVVAVGTVLGSAVTALNLLGVWAALLALAVPAPTIAVPWALLGATAGICAVLAVVSAVVPAGIALRTRPVELAGTPA